MAYAIVTPEKQKQFSSYVRHVGVEVKVPDICGYLGRACRQMGQKEGANRAICMKCSLACFIVRAP